MAALTWNAINKDGVEIASLLVAADAGGDTLPTGPDGLIVIANGDASPHTATIAGPVADQNCGNFGEQAIADVSIVVPAGETHIFTVPRGYAQSGLFSISYDAVTSVTVGGIVAHAV